MHSGDGEQLEAVVPSLVGAAKAERKTKTPIQSPCLGWIFQTGATTLAVFGGIMESTFFTEDLLSKCLMPFIHETFPDGHRFQQDNDPKHTSKLTQMFIERTTSIGGRLPRKART